MAHLLRQNRTLVDLPFYARVVIKSAIILLGLCGRDTRISALMGLLAYEAASVTETRDEYEQIIDMMGEYMKIEHERLTQQETETA
jgi:hypothetical protein